MKIFTAKKMKFYVKVISGKCEQIRSFAVFCGFAHNYERIFNGKLNPLTTTVSHHIETCQLIWIANQLTDFYMIGNIGR